MPLKSRVPDLDIPDVSLPEFILGHLQRYGDSVALFDNKTGQSVSHRDVYTQTIKCACFLRKQGLKKGDVVAVCLPSCIEYAAISLGIMACGATAALCNPEYTVTEVVQQFNVSKPAMVFTTEKSVKTIDEVKNVVTSIKDVIVFGKSLEFNDHEAILDEDNVKCYLQDVDARMDVALIAYSSGTTGLPKGVMFTHRNLVASAVIFAELSGYTKSDIVCTDRPMYNAGGFAFLFYGLPIGVKIVFEQDFETVCLPEVIETHKISILLGVPQALLALAQNPDPDKYDTSSLKEIRCGGAMLPPQLLRTVSEKYETNIAVHYGSTEAGEISSNSDIYRYEGSVGVLFPNTEAKIVDLVTNVEIPDGGHGEILIRSPQTFKGYLEKPELTANVYEPEGWFHTGDLGYVCNKMLYICDRLKEVIKYKTLQVAPAELEAVIFKHAKVADAGVIGIPDSYSGELPKAFVVKKDDSLTAEELQEFLNAELADYKRLRGGVEFVEKIPRSFLGKIQRNKLKELHQSNADI